MFRNSLINSNIAIKCNSDEEIIRYVDFLNKHGTHSCTPQYIGRITPPVYIVSGKWECNWGFTANPESVAGFTIKEYYQAIDPKNFIKRKENDNI